MKRVVMTPYFCTGSLKATASEMWWATSLPSRNWGSQRRESGARVLRIALRYQRRNIGPRHGSAPAQQLQFPALLLQLRVESLDLSFKKLAHLRGTSRGLLRHSRRVVARP